MPYPKSFKDITFKQFNRWQASHFATKNCCEARQIQSLLDVADHDLVDIAVNLPVGYMHSIMSKAKELFKTVDSVTFSILGKSVKISRGADLFDLNLGSAEQIQEIHDAKCVEIFSGDYFEAISDEFSELRHTELTDAQKDRLVEFQNFAISSYYKIIPELFAWAIVGFAGLETTEANYNIALNQLNNMSAFRIQPLVDAFFLSNGMMEMYPPNSSIFLLLEQLERSKWLSSNCISIRRRLVNRHA